MQNIDYSLYDGMAVEKQEPFKFTTEQRVKIITALFKWRGDAKNRWLEPGATDVLIATLESIVQEKP